MQFAIVFGVFISFVSRNFVDSSFVDPSIVHQDNFRGWGTSLAWWADMVGGMEPNVAEHVVDALFSPSKLNLNIVRYVIGGTTPDNYTCGDYRPGAATESYKDGLDSPYMWNRDLRQRKILEMAKSKGANIFEAFSNSPPQWMTISGCSKGNNRNAPLHGNFDPVNADHFADYATEVIKHFRDSLNITFTTYSPFNEPFGMRGIGGWAGSASTQEGCNMDRTAMVAVIKSVYAAIQAKSLTSLKIAVSDETQLNTQIASYDHFVNEGVSSMFGQVNVHGYWDQIEVSRRDLLNMRCTKAGHDLWMDEMGWSSTPVDDMEQGLNIAERIITDLRNLIPSAWVYWQAVADNGGWGLLDVPFKNPTIGTIRYNSGYYTMQQFTLHILKGSTLVYSSDERSIAALNLAEKKMIIITLNTDTVETTLEYDLSLFDSVGNITLFRTSPTEQHSSLTPPVLGVGNKVSLVTPPQSISTLEVSNIAFSTPINLIKNGDFESVEVINSTLHPTSWEVLHEPSGASDGDAWRDQYSGLLTTSPNNPVALMQNITLSLADHESSRAACTLFLSAWCLSTQPGTKLGVIVNGVQGPEVDINRNGAYSSYGVSFSANTGESIHVSFINRGDGILNGVARIDNVILHAKC